MELLKNKVLSYWGASNIKEGISHEGKGKEKKSSKLKFVKTVEYDKSIGQTPKTATKVHDRTSDKMTISMADSPPQVLTTSKYLIQIMPSCKALLLQSDRQVTINFRMYFLWSIWTWFTLLFITWKKIHIKRVNLPTGTLKQNPNAKIKQVWIRKHYLSYYIVNIA